MTPRTRGWIIALAVLNVLLMVAFAAQLILAAAPDDDGEPVTDEAASTSTSTSAATSTPEADPETAAPTTPTATPELAAPPEGAVELSDFTLPSRNITCGLDEGAVTCTIADASFTPPPGEECEGRGQVVQLSGDGVVLPCPEEPASMAAEDVPVLEYGQAATLGPWACTSSERGAECYSLADGTGFTLARAALTSYGPGRLS